MKSSQAFRRAMAIIDLLATCHPLDRKDLVIFAAAFRQKFDELFNRILDQIDEGAQREHDQLHAMLTVLLHGIELNSGVEAETLGIKAMWPLSSQKEVANV
jgi:hypothetical protein